MQPSSFGRYSQSAPRALMVAALGLTPACSFGGQDCRVVDGAAPIRGLRDGRDVERENRPAVLRPVLRDCGDIVDIQFVPGSSDKAVVIDQKGAARWVDFAAKTTGTWLELNPSNGWEQGLLGLAFHPKFTENGRFFLNWTAKTEGRLVSQVGAFQADASTPFASTPTQKHLVYEVEQPYGNHNAGGLGFGPDGMLYIGWGDGGKANDPHENGQNKKTALGAMLRVDVDGPAPFRVPPDNPFVDDSDALPEVWAIGLRNPWRYTWDAKGRMVVADVGQNKWEEVTFLEKGSNAGWNTREGAHCFDPAEGCATEGLLDPLWDYDHSEGQSITGGYVASQPDALKGRYVVGDFGSGRIWAIGLPDTVGERTTDVGSVGRFPIQISTFGRDDSGRIYVAGWTDKTVYRLDSD